MIVGGFYRELWVGFRGEESSHDAGESDAMDPASGFFV